MSQIDIRLEHAVNVVGRGVADFPRLGAVAFMTVGEGADQCEQTLGIGEHVGRAVGVYGDVVPGGHDFAVLGLGRVKRWADVGIGAGEDHQGFTAVLQILPLWIGLRQVPVKRAVRAFGGVQQQRQMAGQQALFVNAFANMTSNFSGVPLAFAFIILLGMLDRKSTRLNSSHNSPSRMPSSA